MQIQIIPIIPSIILSATAIILNQAPKLKGAGAFLHLEFALYPK